MPEDHFANLCAVARNPQIETPLSLTTRLRNTPLPSLETDNYLRINPIELTSMSLRKKWVDEKIDSWTRATDDGVFHNIGAGMSLYNLAIDRPSILYDTAFLIGNRKLIVADDQERTLYSIQDFNLHFSLAYQRRLSHFVLVECVLPYLQSGSAHQMLQTIDQKLQKGDVLCVVTSNEKQESEVRGTFLKHQKKDVYTCLDPETIVSGSLVEHYSYFDLGIQNGIVLPNTTFPEQFYLFAY